jgi:hypothetical protein
MLDKHSHGYSEQADNCTHEFPGKLCACVAQFDNQSPIPQNLRQFNTPVNEREQDPI